MNRLERARYENGGLSKQLWYGSFVSLDSVVAWMPLDLELVGLDEHWKSLLRSRSLVSEEKQFVGSGHPCLFDCWFAQD